MAQVVGISIGSDGTKCCVDSAGFAYRLYEISGGFGGWRRNSTAKDVKEIAVGNAHHIVCRNGSGDVFYLESDDWSGKWIQYVGAKNVQTISVGDDATVWVGNQGGKLFKLTSGGIWKENPHASDVKEVTVGHAGHVWCRNGAGKVFKLQGRDWNDKWVEESQASMVQSISAAMDGTVWLSSADPADKDRLFMREEPNSWKRDATGKAVQVSVGAADKVVCVDAGGAIYGLVEGNWVSYYGLDVNSVHTVKKGDTLYSIVRGAFDLTGAELTAKVNEVAAKNGITNKDKIDVGDVINLD